MPRPRVAFVSMAPLSSFVQEDLRILNEAYTVSAFSFQGASGQGGSGAIGKARTLLSEQVRLRRWLRHEMPGAAAAFGWFADYHTAPLAASARRNGVPMLLVIGGYDAMRVPDRGHGVYASRWRAPLARRASEASTVLLPVADALMRTTNAFLPEASREQGVEVFAPAHAPALTVPTGYDPDAWPMGPAQRTPRVLTVGVIDSPTRVWIKGIDLVLQVARLLPEVPFEIVGTPNGGMEALGLHPPENVECHPAVPRDALAAAYQRASVYLQPSRVEGMPNVLCEAMLCGAVPVGTEVFGIPAAIGDAGAVVSRPDAQALAAGVREALSAPPAARDAARQRIASSFPLARRRRVLHRLVDGLTRGTAPEALIQELS